MAFEDRCSPSQANSPGPVTGRVPPTNYDNSPPKTAGYNNVSSSQYTCTTMENRYVRDSMQNGNQNLMSVVKIQPVSPPPSPDQRTISGLASQVCYESYYKQFPNNDLSGTDREMMDLSRVASPDIKPNIEQLKQNAFCRNNFEMRNDNERRRTIEDVNVSINFSISDILHPEFGLSAIRRTNKREGPKIGGPNHSILYKPYDLSKQNGAKLNKSDSGKSQNHFSYDYLSSASAKEDDHCRMAPLGSLRHAVSQIGLQSREMDLSAKGFDACGQSKVEIQNKRPDSASSVVSSASSGAPSAVSSGNGDAGSQSGNSGNSALWPAWVYCTRYSDRPSSGPRSRRAKKSAPVAPSEDKRPRTAFSGSQLSRLKHEFAENKYLTERRRQQLASELGLAEAQIKIWFQNKRAKIKKATGQRNPLALQLMAQGLYNHTTANESDEEDEEISVT